MTLENIRIISSKKQAVPNKKYYISKNEVYIGNSNGSLRRLELAENIITNTSSNVQTNLKTLINYNEGTQELENGDNTYSYDENNNLISVVTLNQLGKSIGTKTLSYDEDGNLSTLIVVDAINNITKTFTYDGDGNLINKITT